MGSRAEEGGAGRPEGEEDPAIARPRATAPASFDDGTETFRPDLGVLTPGARQMVITVISGPQAGLSRVLDKSELVVGRAPECDIMIEDTALSRRHCRFIERDGVLFIEDLGSSNGTLVSGERLREPRRVSDGDRVQAGRSLLGLSRQDRLEHQAHRHLYESSMSDPLTGLHNRRYFEQRLREEFAYALRVQGMLQLLILEVDEFKKLDVTWGREAGETVLKNVAPVLRRNLRTDDVAARLHAEQFAVLARVTGSGDERALGERVRKQIHELLVAHGAHVISVTASVGVASLRVTSHDESPIALIAAADRALYRAKRAGGNRCEHA